MLPAHPVPPSHGHLVNQSSTYSHARHTMLATCGWPPCTAVPSPGFPAYGTSAGRARCGLAEKGGEGAGRVGLGAARCGTTAPGDQHHTLLLSLYRGGIRILVDAVGFGRMQLWPKAAQAIKCTRFRATARAQGGG